VSAADFLKKCRIPCLYHFTDQANLPLIKKHGGLYSLRLLRSKGIKVPRPGGNDWSWEADERKRLDTYVHLSFGDDHPMRYVAEKEGRIGPVTVLKIDVAALSLPGILCTDAVSNKSGVEPFGLGDAHARIDFQVLTEWTDWKDSAVLARRTKAMKAEVLIPDHVPLKLLSGL